VWIGVPLALVVAWVSLAGRVLVVTDDPGAPDGVVVLAGDPFGWRLEAGVDTFRESGADALIVMVASTGPAYDPPG
jgi:hypothetical protein